MNVANKQLCQELYELSGWDDSESAADYAMEWHMGHKNDSDYKIAPMYDLGYLLRNLPMHYLVSFVRTDTGKAIWSMDHRYKRQNKPTIFADSPEDAVAELAIELFKQGALTKEKT